MMRKGFALIGFAAVVGAMVASVAAQNPPAGQGAPGAPAVQGGGGRGAAPTPASCGPNPPAEMKNVARDSRCFELRTYVVNPGGPGDADLNHKRFREHTISFFKKYGMTVIGFWIPVTKPDTLVYMLAYKDAAARDAAWAAFQSDPDWIKVRAEMNVSLTVTNEFMIATDYSPVK
jgi:hypothetical protein